MDNQYLTPQEVASQLRVDAQTVRRWCLDGQLKASRLGPKVFRIAQGDLAAFLAKSELSR